VTNPNNETTGYDRDNLGRVTQVNPPDPDGLEPPDNPWVHYKYDAMGNVIRQWDPVSTDQHPVVYGYDELYRLTSLTDENGDTTEYEYDAAGNRVKLIDPIEPNGNQTTWLYDELNRPYLETNAFGNREYHYDAVGNLQWTQDRNERVIDYEYDKLYRLTTEIWRDEVGDPFRFITYTHYESGDLSSVYDTAGTSHYYAYDDRGRNTLVRDEIDGLSPDAVLGKSYDAEGNRTQLLACLDDNRQDSGDTNRY